MTIELIEKTSPFVHKLFISMVFWYLLVVTLYASANLPFVRNEGMLLVSCLFMGILLAYIYDFLVLRIKYLLYRSGIEKMDPCLFRIDVVSGFFPLIVVSFLLLIVQIIHILLGDFLTGIPSTFVFLTDPAKLHAPVYLISLLYSAIRYYRLDMMRAHSLSAKSYTQFKAIFSLFSVYIIFRVVLVVGINTILWGMQLYD